MSAADAAGGDSDDSDGYFPSFASAPAAAGPGALVAVDPEAKRRRHGRHDERHGRRKRQQRGESGRRVLTAPGSDDVWQQLVDERVVSVDTRGDASLAQFHQSTRSAAPQFARRSGRLVVGLGRRLRIDEAAPGTAEISLVPADRKHPMRYRDADWAVIDRDTVRVVAPAAAEPLLPRPTADYVPVAEPGPGVPSAAASGYDSDDGRRPDFRSLDGMAGAAGAGRGRQPECTGDDRQAAAAAAVRARTAELEARISNDRHDIGGWEALAGHQEAVVRGSLAGQAGRRRIGRRAVAEMRSAVFRRGLRHSPDARALVLGLLRQRAELADDSTLLTEWTAAADGTSDPEIVLHHVRFCQTLASRFSVPWLARVYADSARRIARCVVRALPAAREFAAVALMELVHCACLFLREAGLAERALATYQAAVEWHVMTSPAAQQQPASHRRSAFRRFWDAGHPRIGAGGDGWCSYGAAAAIAGSVPSGSVPASARIATGAATVAEWHALETQQVQAAGLAPWAAAPDALTAEQVAVADPFAVVVFEDVEPFLVDLPPSAEAAQALVDRFLQFLGAVGPRTCVLTQAPAAHRLATSEQAWSIPDDSLHAALGLADPADQANAGAQWPWTGFPLVAVPVTRDTADTPLGPAYTRVWRRAGSAEYRAAAAAALWHLRGAERLDERARAVLGVAVVESAFQESAEHGRAQARRLLQLEADGPGSLALWNTLAKMHARTGDWAEARRVWAAALAMAPAMPAGEQAWVPVLCKSWAVLEAFHGRGLAAAIRVIAACGTGPDALRGLVAADDSGDSCCSAADILCARRTVDGFARAAGEAEAPAEARLAVLTLRLWVAYGAQRSVGAAEAAFAEHSGDTEAEGELEQLAVCSVHLFHAMTARVVRAGDLRNRVAGALQAFPHSTVLWEMLRYAERRSPIAARVARRLAAATLAAPEPCPDLRLLAVYAARGGRRALQLATRNGDSASLLAWMAAIAVECRAGAPRRAKRLLLAALRRCPWAKALYLLAAGGALAAQFSADEQHALLRAMVRAGIRTRASLADVCP
ncbi:hypothetical protein H4R19_002456 [Coemansia spiralis]|nr:hypothetical protein H4R19_002456 [Coemansia spiralis]